ncbi:beta/gamma crystallin domain-containing protein 1 isoform X2 [Eublepharis macularius]|uniref:Beta/gamma crystallin domain-containing protein 1 isoform X2 n=1 Tax=Eublepharis macularius TaxID=481883 RepID=A0AA97LI88_EUBMA|nr:beta/gamma crystallin domain-containing protein 1 isoform X2 [Eublepharis macularius]
MEKGGFKRLGRLFHKSESEDSEPDTSRETPLPSPCPSPSLQGRGQHRHGSPLAGGGERKKRSAFGNWRLKKKHKERQATAVEASSFSQLSAPASPSLSLSSHFTASSEPASPTDRYFDMPDTEFAAPTNQPSPVPSQETQFPYAISMVSISAATLPSSFRKSKTHSPESSKEEKKKPVLGKFGNFFTTGRRKNTKNTSEDSLRPNVKTARSGSPRKNPAPLASIEDFKEISKSEECLLEKICNRNQSVIQNTVAETEEYFYTKDLTPLYNDIVSEWNSKGASSDSEWSPDWHSSSETIKNTLFDSNLTLQTPEPEKYLITDATKTTTPNFFRSLSNISNEDQEHSILNHKQLLNVDPFAELEGAATKVQSSVLESKPSERSHSSRVLTLDIFLRRTEQSISNEFSTALLDDNYSSADEMDKKSAIRRSGKRRKSQSSSDVPNGDRNATENVAKEETVLDDISSDLVVEQMNNSERKVKSSATANHEMKTGSNQKGCSKMEMEKNKQPPPTSSPYRRKSLKKNQSDTVLLSPTGLKSQGKDSPTKRQVESAANGSSLSKTFSVEKLTFGENIAETFKVASVGVLGNSTSSLIEGRRDSAHSCDGSGPLHADKNKNGGMGTTNGKHTSSDLDSTKQRNTCWDVSRTVTTKVNLPAKPKNVELNLKTPRISDDVGNEQDSLDKAAKNNFSIANKISMFESKHSNQNQPAEVSASKKGSVSNTFVGRAKLKFGKQPAEGELTNRVTSKPNSRQKPLQNGARMKGGSAETKIKHEEGTQAGIINEEVRNTMGSPLNQNGKDDNYDDQVSVFVSKKLDSELGKDTLLPKTTSLQQSKEMEASKNSINKKMNATSVSPESGDRLSHDRDTCSHKVDRDPQQSDLVLTKSELEKNMDSDNKNANTVSEGIQIFELNSSVQQSLSSTSNIPKAGNDSICDSPSDMEKFTETIKNLDSSVCIPQKKKKTKLPKSPAPHFAMPPIHEDNLEKVFDPNIFTVGLGIKRDRPLDLAPSLQLKLQTLETETKVRPKRASAENSMLLQSLKSSHRRDPTAVKDTSGKENLDSIDGDIKRSRLESSAIFSSLLSTKDKVFMPSVTSINTMTTSFTSQKSADSAGKPPLRFDTAQLLEAFSGKNQAKINPRPGKIVIYNKPDPSEKVIEVFHDMPDCSSWVLSPVIFIKVIRGCWILYEKPNFEGPSIPLEEGELELSNMWGEQPSDSKDECKPPEPAVIGSVRRVVKDYRLCRIDLFTEPGGLGMVKSYFDDTEETRIIGATEKTRSLQVYWGIWLLYEEPGFQGIPLMLEPGEYPDLSFWEKKEAYIRSMRPLKMGGRKVECPENPKVIIYEKPFFEGNHIELDTELAALPKGGNREKVPEMTKLLFASVGSMKVLGGIWVAYEKPGFTEHQYLLEEGEYREWMDWGGYDEQVQSLRPILGNVTQPHMIMYTEKDFGTKGSSINVLGIISSLKDTGYGLRTQSINVLSGVWVAYENPDFTGEQYILDKGMYPNYETWGGRSCKISSVQPIVLDTNSDYMGKFKVQLFSEPEFQGRSQVFEKDTSQIDDSFPIQSSKVLSGSWIAYDKEDFSGNQYVLEEGAYPDLFAMGCLPQTCLKSLQAVNIELSEPVIALFEKGNFKGKKMEFATEIVNLKFLGYNPHVASVQVLGGMWIIYEHNNYRGRQILLKPKKIPNWHELSGFHKIGSLRPLLQKRVYFRLRNKETGQFISTDGNVDDLNLLRMQVTEDNTSDEQVWVYQGGYLKCRMAEDFCLTIVGSLITPGAKLGLALEQNEEKQHWSINPDGRIYSKIKPNLVLDIKGGTHYDQNHLIISSVSEDKATQCWEPLVV